MAAATSRNEEFGDVLVADSAYDYGSGKIVEMEDGERILIPSPNQLDIDPNLHAVIQRWERDQTQMSAIQQAWYNKQQRTPRLIVGVLATGAAVVQSPQLVKEILSKSRKVVGLDMEAYAIFHAAHLASLPRPSVLVAKAVSDFADKEKKDDWQQYAAFTSAHFIYEFFTTATEFQLGKPFSAI